jgi:hypothetical protein
MTYQAKKSKIHFIIPTLDKRYNSRGNEKTKYCKYSGDRCLPDTIVPALKMYG